MGLKDHSWESMPLFQASWLLAIPSWDNNILKQGMAVTLPKNYQIAPEKLWLGDVCLSFWAFWVSSYFQGRNISVWEGTSRPNLNISLHNLFIWGRLKYSLEVLPSQKENNLPTITFQVAMLNFGCVVNRNKVDPYHLKMEKKNYKWPCKWATGVTTPINGVITYNPTSNC